MSILYESLGESLEDTKLVTIETPEPEPKTPWGTVALLAAPVALLTFFVLQKKKK